MRSLETNEVFRSNGYLIRGVLYWPLARESRKAVVMCYPLAEERKSAARVLTLMAREFARQGFHVLRFDYRGTGESDGDFRDFSISHWLDDIVAARQHLMQRTHANQVGLVGLRFGGTLAVLSAETARPAAFMILWDPFISGDEYLQEYQRRIQASRLVIVGGTSSGLSEAHQPDDQGFWDWGGYIWGPQLRKELESLDLQQEAWPMTPFSVVVRCSAANKRSARYDKLAKQICFTSNGGRSIHFPARPFWVTASRYDPCDLVRTSLDYLFELGYRSNQS